MIYSHGFEEIYALEKVNVDSIRRIPKEEKKKSTKKSSKGEQKPQLQLDFGDAFRVCLPSFVLTEPIQRIGLAKNIEAWLVSRNILTVEALTKADLKELPDAHHQEIDDKLKNYISDRPLYDTTCVDYSAWLRGLIGSNEPIAASVFLEFWGIEDVIDLQAQERVAKKALNDDKRQQMVSAIRERLKSKSDHFSKATRQLDEVFIRPWMRERCGLATRLELTERLIAIGEDSSVAGAAVRLFSDVFCYGSFMLNQYLFHADERLYCSDEAYADAYDTVVDKAHSYFYKKQVHYPLNQLEELLNREMASEWCGFPDGFVRKVLRYSPQFYVRKNETEQLIIYEVR